MIFIFQIIVLALNHQDSNYELKLTFFLLSYEMNNSDTLIECIHSYVDCKNVKYRKDNRRKIVFNLNC